MQTIYKPLWGFFNNEFKKKPEDLKKNYGQLKLILL